MTFHSFLAEGVPLRDHMEVAIPDAIILRDLALLCQFIDDPAVVDLRCADHLHLESHLLQVRLTNR